MPGRRPRWKRGDKFADERCGICGCRQFASTVDASGRVSRSCMRCKPQQLPAEVQRKLEEEGRFS